MSTTFTVTGSIDGSSSLAERGLQKLSFLVARSEEESSGPALEEKVRLQAELIAADVRGREKDLLHERELTVLRQQIEALRGEVKEVRQEVIDATRKTREVEALAAADKKATVDAALEIRDVKERETESAHQQAIRLIESKAETRLAAELQEKERVHREESACLKERERIEARDTGELQGFLNQVVLIVAGADSPYGGRVAPSFGCTYNIQYVFGLGPFKDKDIMQHIHRSFGESVIGFKTEFQEFKTLIHERITRPQDKLVDAAQNKADTQKLLLFKTLFLELLNKQFGRYMIKESRQKLLQLINEILTPLIESRQAREKE